MAQTKEGLVVILDVSKNTRKSGLNGEQSFFEKQRQCCVELLQKKIFAGKKDEIAFVLMGTDCTDNELNRNLGGYDNIVEGISMQMPNWDILGTLVKSIDLEKGSEVVDWVDAVVIALDILRREEAKRFKYWKVILFHQFLYSVDDSSTKEVIQGLKEINAELVIINDNIKYKDDSETNSIKSFFPNANKKTTEQMVSEKLAKKLIDETDGILCNFDIAVDRMVRGLKPKGRPWWWYSTLDIGSKVKIHIGVTISIKSEGSISFKTESAKPNSISFIATEYLQNGEKIASKQKDAPVVSAIIEELIDGYMLGSTPIPYDKTLPQTKKGIQCIGFTQKSNVLPQYLLGTGTNLVFARPTMETSEKMMAALVKGLDKNNMVMIGRRVYNDGYRPKFIALFPNPHQEYPCLTLFELFCAEQEVNWHFPSLTLKRTEPNKEQYIAIESLMDAMNLDDDSVSKGEIREQYEKDLLPLNKLLNVTNDYILHVTTQRIIEEAKEISLTLQGRDNVFNVPDILYKRSQEPLEKIKELFPLEEIKKEGKKELIRHCGNIDSREMDNEIVIEEKPLEYKSLISVGTVTPAEDYKELIKREVEEIAADKEDQKIPTFDKLTRQIQEVLRDLIFRTISLQYEKIVKSFKMYRDTAAQYNPYDFNDFIREIKAMSVSRKMYEFWDEVIVKNQLGLLSSKDCCFFNKIDDVNDVDEFYKIDFEKQIEIDDNNDGNIDDMFDDM